MFGLTLQSIGNWRANVLLTGILSRLESLLIKRQRHFDSWSSSKNSLRLAQHDWLGKACVPCCTNGAQGANIIRLGPHSAIVGKFSRFCERVIIEMEIIKKKGKWKEEEAIFMDEKWLRSWCK